MVSSRSPNATPPWKGRASLRWILWRTFALILLGALGHTRVEKRGSEVGQRRLRLFDAERLRKPVDNFAFIKVPARFGVFSACPITLHNALGHYRCGKRRWKVR